MFFFYYKDTRDTTLTSVLRTSTYLNLTRPFSLYFQLDSLQQTRGQLLKVSEQISSTMRSSQEQLTVKLQQSQAQLEQVKTELDCTKAQLDQTTTELDCTRDQVGQLKTQLDQSQAQFLQIKTQLEQSRIHCEQTRAQNAHLHTQLEKMTVQLNQTRVQAAQLQTQLLASEKFVETSNDSLLIKVHFYFTSFNQSDIMKVLNFVILLFF